ncbi:PLDc N-terminal domain-containing protein [Microbacterium sp. NPDC076911]|uniref:PLDc N-terminal domain-containing protein n=1 Tax=Microbacterium sp. NPDC076911 TaxID=3154958 RepID=UPI0034218F53
MLAVANPLAPASYDVIWSIVMLAIAVLTVVAMVSWWRATKWLSLTERLMWVMLIVFVPLFGPLAWFAIGRRCVAQACSLPSDSV